MADSRINEWLLDYLDMMESIVKLNPNPTGLHMAVRVKRVKRQIDEVRAYLAEQPQ